MSTFNLSQIHSIPSDYAQALGFDQLKKLMLQGERELLGFEEGLIDFPPTFKYDVQRGIKSSKSQRSIKRWRSIAVTASKKKELSEIQERDNWQAVHEDTTVEDQEDLDLQQDDHEGDEDEEETNDMTSFVSSVWTSKHSKANTDIDENEDYFQRPSSSKGNQESLAHKLQIVTAAHKAKAKWMSLLTPLNTPATPKRWSRSKSEQGLGIPSDDASLAPLNAGPMSITSKSKSTPIPIGSAGHASSLADSPMPSLSHATPSMARQSSTRSPSSLHSEESNDEAEPGSKGVYDSSHKQRVPSW
jgi:hypothetical protein